MAVLNWADRYQVQQKKLIGLQDVRNKAALDARWFMERNLVIATKKRREQKLIFNHSQRRVWDKIEELKLLGMAIRLIILKSRQVGISTQIAGYGFTRWWAERNFNALIIAHLKQVTANLFKKSKKFYIDLRPELRIPLERSNKQELIQDVAWGGSQLFLTTAGSPHEARSQTIHFVHGSEAAFYPDLEELKTALEASVPDDPDTAIFWESTAFGAGTQFHELYKYGKSEEGLYVSMFLKWFEDPECSLPKFSNDLVRDKFLERVFAKASFLKDRMEHYGLTPEQICWYFMYCVDKYQGNWLKMQQEYPCDDEEAFLASGATIIPTNIIQAYKKLTKQGTMYDPLQMLEWNGEVESWKRIKNPYLERDRDSYLEVWQEPIKQRHYLISVDTASGQAEDNSCVMVFDILTQNLVAELHGKIDPKRLALFTARLGSAYNNAVVCVEVNGLGLATLSHLEDKYFNLYRRRSRGLITGTVMTDKIGWDMNEDLRWIILANMRRVMTERLFDEDANPQEFLPSPGLNGEMSTFIQPPNPTNSNITKKPQAERGCNDDRVICAAIGIYACLEEIQSRPDICPVGFWEVPQDDKLEYVDLEALNAMVDDPAWTGLTEYTPSVLANAPFIMADLRDDDDYTDLLDEVDERYARLSRSPFADW